MNTLLLSPDVCTIPGFLSAQECEALIGTSETSSYEAASVDTPMGARMIESLRNNDRLTVDDTVLAGKLFARLAEVFPLVHRGAFEAVGLNERMRYYRYGPGQQFNWHKDGVFARGEEASRFTFMVYLNDACEGGETMFKGLPAYGDGRSYPTELAVRPETGTALLFHHPLVHKGEMVRSGVKYVLRTDVMYRLIQA